MTEARWRQLTEIPLLMAGLVFYVTYAWPILDQSMAPRWRLLCHVLTFAIWSAFIVDYFVRLYLARGHRRAFVRGNPLDLAALVLPVLRPIRIVSQLQRVSWTHERLRVDPHQRLATYGLASVLLLGFAAAVAVLDVERNAVGSTITTFGDAVWWTLTTVTTVGYGDTYPVTVRGRLIGSLVMIGGIAVLGVVSASVATWFTGRFQKHSDQVDERQAGEARVLLAEVRELRAAVDRALPGQGPASD
ncbi:ion channel [Nonomuraea sp. NPDC046570]|uniref:ion channel n=1 Tax=Nonomuraea sp. NPDC046570 TaxID=3155255 RepID=UPI0033D76A6C